MVKIKISSDSDTLYKVMKICSHELGRRTYWIHDRVGGPGWSVDLVHHELSIKDDEKATFITLKL